MTPSATPPRTRVDHSLKRLGGPLVTIRRSTLDIACQVFFPIDGEGPRRGDS
jgi:hypothetical protein